MSTFTDNGQGAGLSTSTGARPFLVLITTAVMARADAGVDFDGTDWHWMVTAALVHQGTSPGE